MDSLGFFFRIDFKESFNDDSEIDANDLIDYHIHQLAIEERLAKHRKWKSFLSYVAAASVVILFGVTVFMAIREHTSTPETILALENQVEYQPTAINKGLQVTMADSSKMTITKAEIEAQPKLASISNPKRKHIGKGRGQQKASTELRLIETITEINAGLINMDDNALECISMTNERLNVIENNLIDALNEIRCLNIDLNFE